VSASFELTPLAAEDLYAIWWFIAKDNVDAFGPVSALKVVDKMLHHLAWGRWSFPVYIHRRHREIRYGKTAKDENRDAKMSLQIDDEFIGRWEPLYDDPRIGGDDEDHIGCSGGKVVGYKTLITRVGRDVSSTGTISKNTFLEIWKWKGAMRVLRHVRLEKYNTLYAPAFKSAAAAPPEKKLAALLAGGTKLPGVGAPTGSTIIHFIHPDTMPIIDARTVEVLFEAKRISTKQRVSVEHYENFRMAMDKIRDDCRDRTLRKIDRALFAYHKRSKLAR
jgi:plasmid stabilization system protein ParE